MTSPDIIQQFTRVAEERGLEPACLLAVAELETALRPFANVDGRKEPLIRFEGHYFDRRLSPANRQIAREANLSSPRAGGSPIPPPRPRAGSCSNAPPASTARRPTNPFPGGSAR
jgi:hypothetical protein